MPDSGKKQWIGIYGGTFAPVHNGHVYAAKAFLRLLPLDKLLIMPTKKPPHKKISASDDPAKRLAMLRLAFPEAENPRITVSDYELCADHPSYTALTLEHFASPGVRLIFFCGTDMFRTLDSWYHPEIIFGNAAIAHIRRNECTAADEAEFQRLAEHYRTSYGAEILQLSVPPFPQSSTEVRRAVREHRDISAMVPEKVAAYIRREHLYESESEGTP